MTLKSTVAGLVAGLIALSSLAESTTQTNSPSGAPDKAKLSYAVGMRMGSELQQAKVNVDFKAAIHAIQDVLDGKPTLIQESNMVPILNQGRSNMTGKMSAEESEKFSYAGGMHLAMMFKRSGAEVDAMVVGQAIQDLLDGKPKMNKSEVAPIFMQEQIYQRSQKSTGNKALGEAFLAKNAKEPGVTTLTDGLQYQVIQAGTGPFATTNDFVYVKFRGTFINGAEFDHHQHWLTKINGGLQGWRDVLPKMRVGSKWRIFLPPDLAFGQRGESFHGIGPDLTVIYDLELLSIAPPGGHYEVNSRMGHGLDIGNSDSGK